MYLSPLLFCSTGALTWYFREEIEIIRYKWLQIPLCKHMLSFSSEPFSPLSSCSMEGWVPFSHTKISISTYSLDPISSAYLGTLLMQSTLSLPLSFASRHQLNMPKSLLSKYQNIFSIPFWFPILLSIHCQNSWKNCLYSFFLIFFSPWINALRCLPHLSRKLR